MTASCYLCAIGSKTIPYCEAGDAVGVCKVCSVLACQGHAVRDANYPRWICVLCDVTLLATAAVLQSGDEDALRDVSRELIDLARPIRSARQYFEGRGDSWSWVAEAAREYRDLPASALEGESARVWRRLTADGQELMRCAMAIADRLEVRDSETLGFLRGLRAALVRRG